MKEPIPQTPAKEWALKFLEVAKSIASFEEVQAILFFTYKDQKGVGAMPVDTSDKDIAAAAMAYALAKNDTRWYAFVSEAYASDKAPEELEQKMRAGEMRVSELPEEYRKEAIIVVFYDGVEEHMLIQPFVRSGNDITFEPLRDERGEMTGIGRFEKLYEKAEKLRSNPRLMEELERHLTLKEAPITPPTIN